MRHVKEATHLLICRHCVGRNCREYGMPCIILSTNAVRETARVLVFGDRFWADRDHIQKIKTVPISRLRKYGGEES